MKILDQIAAWALLAIGAFHCAMTPAIYKQYSEEVIWFFTAGLVLILTAVLNLLRIRYATVAAGVRTVSIGVNIVTMLTVLAMAPFMHVTKNPLAWLLIALVVIPTFLSILRSEPTKP